MNYSRKKRRAFSLVELLVVMGIISVVLLLFGGLPSRLGQAFALTQSGEKLSAFLNLARQQAITLNHPVEVRFYKFKEFGAEKFWGMQVFMVDNDGICSPLNKVEKLSQNILIDQGEQLSPLLADAFKKTWTAADPQPSLPQANTSYDCRFFRFFPDGSTSLPSRPNPSDQSWYMTLHSATDGDSLAQPPPNYLTLQINRSNGTLTIFRP